ncbi:BolA-like protein 1 [Paragonimus westermani]|uniref:BolA-like protein 1 n=1 Tax=Paragonimus westermani TaxID=34504 RepID=A0A5J4NXN5_9TREM|nr:BolA-like protein 1 [Paragonimus westermani]
MYLCSLHTTRLCATLSRRFSSAVGPVEVRIRSILTDRFKPIHLKVTNESRKHSRLTGLETHFKITIVSQYFEELSLMERQRLIYKALKGEFESGLHALSINAKSSKELFEELPSPPCPLQRPNKSRYFIILICFGNMFVHLYIHIYTLYIYIYMTKLLGVLRNTIRNVISSTKLIKQQMERYLESVISKWSRILVRSRSHFNGSHLCTPNSELPVSGSIICHSVPIHWLTSHKFKV